MLNCEKMRHFFVFLLLFFPLFYSQGEDTLKEQAKSYREEGYRLQSVGDFKGAMTYYQKAVQLEQQYFEAYNDLGVVYESLGEEEKALDMYKKAVEIENNYLPAYTNLAFLYEKRGDIHSASYYWIKRLDLGTEGEYWYEVARQHLLKLGEYPEIQKQLQERDAIRLSKQLVYKREQEKLKVIEEAKLHFGIGTNLLNKGDYSGAVKELETAMALEPADEQLKSKMLEVYKRAKISHAKGQALAELEDASKSIKNDDFLSAGEKLKNALSTVLTVSPEK